MVFNKKSKKVFLLTTLSLWAVLLCGVACTPSQGDSSPSEQYSLSLNSDELTLDIATNHQLYTTLKLDGKTIDGEYEVEWSSSNNQVATIKDGVLTTLKTGETVITAKYGETAQDSCIVTVEALYIPQILLGSGVAEEVSLSLDGEYTLTPYVKYNGQIFTDAQFSYAIDDETIADVTRNGKITAYELGETQLTVMAKWRGFTENTLNSVYPIRVTEDLAYYIERPTTTLLTISQGNIPNYTVPHTMQLTASVLKDDAPFNDCEVVWSSSDENVITVGENGLLTAVGVGSADITFSFLYNEETYVAQKITFTSEFPVIDKRDSLSLEEMELNATKPWSVLDVFEQSETVTKIYDVTGASKTLVSHTQTGEDIVITSAPTMGNRVWEFVSENYSVIASVEIYTGIITTLDELKAVLKYPGTVNTTAVSYGEGAHYVLGANIDGNGAAFAASAHMMSIASTSPVRYNGEIGFRGVFDGRGYTIDGLAFGIGGLFGNIGKGAVVKNFAVTNATITNNWGAVLCNILGSGAKIENVFIHVKDVSAGLGNVHIIATEVFSQYQYRDTADYGGAVALSGVVIKTEQFTNTTVTVKAFHHQMSYAQYTRSTNVHVVSDYYLFGTSDNAASSLGNQNCKLPNRYGEKAKETSFADVYGSATDVVTMAGLSKTYFRYSDNLGYCVFKSSEIYLEAGEFKRLPNQLTYNVGEKLEYVIPSGCGNVTVSANYTGVSVAGNTVTIAENAPVGTFEISVYHNDFNEEKIITVVLEPKLVEVATLVELSQDANDNLLKLTSTEIVTGGTVWIKAKGANDYTQIDSNNYSYVAGEITFTNAYLKSLAVQGEYSLMVRYPSVHLHFKNVIIYTNVIKTLDELKAVLKYPGTVNTTAVSYGEGTYYVLGGNIEGNGTAFAASAHLMNLASNSPVRYNGEIGFRGVFDGRGYTIDGLAFGIGGLFGNIGKGAVVKNFAVTNATITNNWGAVLCNILGSGAKIENVFIHVKDVSAGLGNVHIIATEVFSQYNHRDNTDYGKAVTLNGVVIKTEQFTNTTVTVKAFHHQMSYMQYSLSTNVHVISDYKLFGTSDDANVNLGNQNCKLPTRYGTNAAYATFAARYTNATTALADAGLDANYWTYNTAKGYPVFTSAINYLQ